MIIEVERDKTLPPFGANETVVSALLGAIIPYLQPYTMTASPAPHHERQLESLLEGFDALKEEYIRLLGRCQVLENNVEMVKSQVRA